MNASEEQIKEWAAQTHEQFPQISLKDHQFLMETAVDGGYIVGAIVRYCQRLGDNLTPKHIQTIRKDPTDFNLDLYRMTHD